MAWRKLRAASEISPYKNKDEGSCPMQIVIKRDGISDGVDMFVSVGVGDSSLTFVGVES